MPKINSLPTDKSLSKNDRLLGSDALGPTRNYKLEDVLAFIRDSNSAGVFGKLSYIYYNRFFGGNSQRPSGSMTIDTSSANTAFDAVSTIKVSKYSYIGEDEIDNILATYLNKQVVIVDNNDPNNFATYVCGGVDQDIAETDFYNLSLTYINGEGSLTSGNVYSTLISPSIGGDSVQSDWNATSGGALILNKPTIPTDNSQLTNGAGYITDGNTNWNNTYGFITGLDWTELGGSQSSINLSGFNNDSGFITSYTETDTLDSVTGRGNTTANDIEVGGLNVDTDLIYTDTVNGRVGIGTNSPTDKLTVIGGNIVTDGGLKLDGIDGLSLDQGGSSVFSPTPGVFYASGEGWYFQVPNNGVEKFSFKLGSTASNRQFRVVDNSWNSLFQVQGNGNVLIGTTTDAGYKLDVNGNQLVTSLGADTGSDVFHLKNSNGRTIFQVTDADRGYFKLGYNNPLFYFGTNPTFYTSNTLVMRLSTSEIATYYDKGFVIYTGSSVAHWNAKYLNSTILLGLDSVLDSSAQVQFDSTNKGFLRQRMTTVQRDAIVSPATGLSVYNTTTNTTDYYNGTNWVSNLSATPTLDQVTTAGNTSSNPIVIGASSLPSTGFDTKLYLEGSGSSVSGRTGFVVKNTNATSAAHFRLLNSNDDFISLQITGPSYTVPSEAGVAVKDTVDLSFTAAGNVASGATNKIGFKTGGYTQDFAMTILGNKNVLIGTTTDAGYKLDVNGTARIGNSSYYLTLANGGADGGILRVGGASYGYAQLKGTALTLNGGHSIVGTGGTKQFIITSNVDPISADDDDYDGAMVFRANNPGAQSYNSWPGYSNAKAFNFIKKNFDGTYTSLMVLHGNNNVGIGVFNPSYKLQVDGTVSAQLTNATQSNQVYYNSATGELTYGAASGGSTPTLDEVTTAGSTSSNNITISRAFPAFFLDHVGTGTQYSGNTIALKNNLIASAPTNTVLSSIALADSNGSSKAYFNFSKGNTVANIDLAANVYGVVDFRVADTGNVLIGTTTDSGEKLQVNGDASASGDINADGDFYQNGTQGWSGTISIPTNPPITITVQGGIITNVT